MQISVRWQLALPLWLVLGCSRTTKPVEVDAAAPPPAVAPSAKVTAGPAPDAAVDAGSLLTDGEHAYQGRLGANTDITMEIVRKGEDVRGSYTYSSFGRPIPLEGKVEPSGAIVLDEKNDGRTTGTLRLQASGDDLIGEWRDPAGTKVYPLRLSSVRVDTGLGSSPLSDLARKCLNEVTCSAKEAADLFVAADDAQEAFVECYRFLDGAGAPRDAVRARACLERKAVTMHCNGDSAFLELEMLAAMRIDGVGGRADIPGARALFAPCFGDVTKDAILGYAGAKERDPKTPAADACDIGGTTLVSNECHGRRLDNERSRALVAAKAIVPTLDTDGLRLFVAANKAYEDYLSARLGYVSEVYRDGSLRIGIALTDNTALVKKRGDDLTAFSTFKAKSATEDDVARAAKAAKTAFTALGRATPELTRTDATWKAYRDAEIAFYDHVFGGAQGHDTVRRAMTIKLSERRAAECPPP